MFDIGLLLYELAFSKPPPDSLQLPETSGYSPRLTDLIVAAFQHATPSALLQAALAAGAEPRAAVVDVDKPAEEDAPLPTHVARPTERNVERLVSGTDIAASFSALLSDLNADPAPVASAIFVALFTKPVSKDPVCAMRIFTMLHNLMIDGPDTMLAAVRKNDKFMQWAESSWTREVIEAPTDDGEERHPATACFAGAELAFYSALLRRKARFHMLAAGGFSGRWDRTGAVNDEGRDVLVTRRRKVLAGMADVIEMASELGGRLASAKDEEAAVKQAALGAIVSECCLAFNAALALASEVLTEEAAEKVAPSVERLYLAARGVVFAVEHVPSAGGEQWVEQFASEAPPDVVGEVRLRAREASGDVETADIPQDGWKETEEIVEDEEKAERKRKREEKRRKKAEAALAKAEAIAKAKEELTASDGALVVHGDGDAAKEAVATMFGDLLSIDDGPKNPAAAPEAPRPSPNMSNAEALASAFGVAQEDASAEQVPLPPPEPFRDDEDEDGGGYADYQARQEQQSQPAPVQEGPRNITAAWAARSGYSGMAMVVSGPTTRKKSSHPVFCQCAICEQEEAQAAAEDADSFARNGFAQRASSHSVDVVGGAPHPPVYNSGYQHKDDAPSYGGRAQTQNYYDDDQKDSLDEEDEGPPYTAPPAGTQNRNMYYENDYDSYESVSYSVEENEPQQAIPMGAPPQQASHTIPMGAPPQQERLAAPLGAAPGLSEMPVERRSRHSTEFVLSPKLVLNLKKLRTGDKISDSQSVAVYKGQYNREDVAIKKLAKSMMDSSTAVAEFKNEVKMMCALSHPALLKCIAASLKKPNYIFVTEFMKRGTLFDVLHKSRIQLTWALIRKIALQLAEGMQHMHENGFLHRDLKSLNVFVDGSYNVKVGDFGLSRHVDETQGSGIAGTYQYMAPEVLRGEPHTDKSDVFSYAQVLCEIVSGIPPFHGMEAREVGERVVNEDIRPPIPRQCQRAYVNLIQMCWGTAPSSRPRFSEIIDLIHSTTK